MSFAEFFAKVRKEDEDAAQRQALEKKLNLDAQRKVVIDLIKAARTEGKRSVLLKCKRWDLDQQVVKELRQECIVKELDNGYNPSTHDPIFAGWEISW